MAFYFVSTFANAQTPTKQRPYGYRGLKIITSLRLRFPDFQRRLDPSSSNCLASRPHPSLKLPVLKENLNQPSQRIGLNNILCAPSQVCRH
ncbi:hypothetical protein [Bathymodiolus japonicus methanotrophic gill symbiont]|uniref:hypothetical protein n=1 Tax=Bathymodiolus japonicus methanotrophic gill symbiont TaxID=113269 RepID=UPI001C8D6906|nr:hypothetical protein [Bathymodiolus japonicus methanotrophic gill symbiont]